MSDRPHYSDQRSARHQAADLRTFSLSLVASRVYAVLCALLPLDVATAVSQTEIAGVARLSQRHVSRALDELADAGLITRTTPASGLPQLVTVLPLDSAPVTTPNTPASQPATVTTLLRTYLAALPAGEEIVTTVRQLAQAIGRPHAGGISPALDRMAQAGEITRSVRNGRTVIQVRHLAGTEVDQGDPPPEPAPVPPFRISTPEASDLPPDRDPAGPGVDQPGCMELDMFHEQQHVAGACESLPEELTPTEWALLRQYDPTYNQDRLRADLATLASRPDVHSPLGLIIRALERKEPLWDSPARRARGAAMTRPYVAPAPRPSRAQGRCAPAPASVADKRDPAVQKAPHGTLWDLLLDLTPDAELVDWLCAGFDLEVQDNATMLHCRDADRLAVARDLRGLLVDALRDLGLPDVLQILPPLAPVVTVQPATPPTAPPDTGCHPVSRPSPMPPRQHLDGHLRPTPPTACSTATWRNS